MTLKTKKSAASKNKRINRKNSRALKAEAAAEHIGISRRHLHDLSAKGRVPYIRVGTRYILYDIADLDRFLDNHKIGI